MANPTSAFGWQMPTSTDLVTDLPADFEVFGQAVDTSLADLKGGTSGQILAKNSNTDMDFTWITNDVGDITAVTAGTGLTGGGTSGAVTLNVDPTYAGFTNMLYAKNAVINGGFDIWQRGTSAVTLSAAAFNYTADRWFTARSAGTSGVTATQATSLSLDGFRYALRIQRTAGDTSTGINYLMTNFETANSIPFANKAVTLSFYARAGANYSATSGALVATLRSGTGTDQSGYTSGWTGSTNVLQQTATLTTSWQRFTYTATVAASATQLGIQFDFTPTGTAGANDWFDITGVQLEAGSTATPFSRNAPSYGLELENCQRYLPAFRGEYSPLNGWFTSTTGGNWVYNFAVPARVAPTGITVSAASDFQLINKAIAAVSPTAITWNYGGTSTASVSTTHTAGSPTSAQGEVGFLRAANSSAYILFTGCEL